MSKAITGPTWALLPPSSLPHGDERFNLLGAIVADFEHPLAEFVPENVSSIIPSKLLCKPTEDANFKVTLTNARGPNVYQRLSDIIRTNLQKNIKDENHLATTKVQTHELMGHDKIFKVLRRLFKEEILGMIGNAPRRNKGAVFMVVAIKICFNAQISSPGLMDENMRTSSPVEETADAEAGASHQEITSAELIPPVATGARIFAVQYRIIKRESVWLRTVMPKIAAFTIGEYLVPSGHSMFGGENEEDEEDGEDDDDDDDDDDDPIQLGDLEHTWVLGSADESDVIMATL